jgi:hypothetical protein
MSTEENIIMKDVLELIEDLILTICNNNEIKTGNNCSIDPSIIPNHDSIDDDYIYEVSF